MGYAGPDIDAELIVMCAELWKKLGIFDVRLEIGTLGSAESRALHRHRLIAYLERHLGKLDDDAVADACTATRYGYSTAKTLK